MTNELYDSGYTKPTNNGKEMAAIIDETETIREINKTITNTPIHEKAASGCSAIIIPRAVATPFPPLKPAKIG